MKLSTRQFFCAHTERTDVDEKGDAICLRCGALLDVVLTREKLDRYVKQALERWSR